MTKSITVVGAGLVGLLTSCLLARQGVRVTLVDKGEPGGRARSRDVHGFRFDMGAHALYLHGALARLLAELDVPIDARPADLASFGLTRGQLAPLPQTGWQMLTTSMPKGAVLSALARLLTYGGDFSTLPAGALIQQFNLAFQGVAYLDTGWQGLVDGLVARALDLGVVLKREHITRLPDGDVVLAVPPAAFTALTGIEVDRTPLVASALSVGLRELPIPDREFVLGIDEPRYFAAQSLATPGLAHEGVLIHAIQYGGGAREDLEDWLDRVQPGWRSHEVARQWLPRIEVVGDIPPRAPVTVRPGLWRVGDWVGPDGLLSDACAASARACAAAILARRKEAA